MPTAHLVCAGGHGHPHMSTGPLEHIIQVLPSAQCTQLNAAVPGTCKCPLAQLPEKWPHSIDLWSWLPLMVLQVLAAFVE